MAKNAHNIILVKPVSCASEFNPAQHLICWFPSLSNADFRRAAFWHCGGVLALLFAWGCGVAAAQEHPVTLRVAERERTNATQWFGATPQAEQYGHLDSLLRISVEQRIGKVDWVAELGQAAELFLPDDAVSLVTAQGQLGLGGTYYASNGNNRFPAAGSLRTGFVRYRWGQSKPALRVGRFEFFEGAETAPKNASLAWLQNYRMAQRLIGNFGFTDGQRSFDGVDLKVTGKSWDLTAMAARSVGGVYNMNANPELNVDAQYLAYSRYVAKDRVLLRGFAIGFHDGRTGVVKTDNRAMAARQQDHGNIRIGSYGTSAMAALPAGAATVDMVFWGVLQNGQWGVQTHRAGAAAVEAGVKFDKAWSAPWVRGGWSRTSGDRDPNDNVHGTFFQVLPTPRNYARFPFFNMMNMEDSFVQGIDRPMKKLELRSDFHWLQLTSAEDFWYQGGGAFDNKVFGYTGRPANGHAGFSTLYDVSADYAVSPRLSLTAYYGRAGGKAVVAAIYPNTTSAQYGFLEVNYKFSHVWGKVAK